jgi:hypothetical protein
MEAPDDTLVALFCEATGAHAWQASEYLQASGGLEQAVELWCVSAGQLSCMLAATAEIVAQRLLEAVPRVHRRYSAPPDAPGTRRDSIDAEHEQPHRAGASTSTAQSGRAAAAPPQPSRVQELPNGDGDEELRAALAESAGVAPHDADAVSHALMPRRCPASHTALAGIQPSGARQAPRSVPIVQVCRHMRSLCCACPAPGCPAPGCARCAGAR